MIFDSLFLYPIALGINS